MQNMVRSSQKLTSHMSLEILDSDELTVT
eukprot:UN12294